MYRLNGKGLGILLPLCSKSTEYPDETPLEFSKTTRFMTWPWLRITAAVSKQRVPAHFVIRSTSMTLTAHTHRSFVTFRVSRMETGFSVTRDLKVLSGLDE